MSDTLFATVTDKGLSLAIDSALADLALAEKYPHNAHLRESITEQVDNLRAEQKRRSELA